MPFKQRPWWGMGDPMKFLRALPGSRFQMGQRLIRPSCLWTPRPAAIQRRLLGDVAKVLKMGTAELGPQRWARGTGTRLLEAENLPQNAMPAFERHGHHPSDSALQKQRGRNTAEFESVLQRAASYSDPHVEDVFERRRSTAFSHGISVRSSDRQVASNRL